MSPKQTDDPDLNPTMDDVSKMLHGDDLHWHSRVKRVLSEAGCQVGRVERQEVHPIWLLWMKRGSFQPNKNKIQASRQIRKVLKKSGLMVKPDELRVLAQRGDGVPAGPGGRWGPGELTTQSPSVSGPRIVTSGPPCRGQP
jgi:hypothetical protein